MPSLSPWDALHPGLSHLPIALLVVLPLVVLAALLSPARRRVLAEVATWLLVVATLGVYLSASTGDAARDIAPKVQNVTDAIAHHENLGAVVRATSTALLVLLATLVYGPGLLKRPLAARTETALLVVFLLLAVAAVVPLYLTAHSGGLLVHVLGVHANIH